MKKLRIAAALGAIAAFDPSMAANARGVMGVRADTDPVKLVQQIQLGFEAFKAQQAETAARVEDFIKAQATGAKDEAAKALKAAEDSAKLVMQLSDRLVEAEQKLVDGFKAGATAPETLGALLIRSDAFKQFQSGATNKFRIEANTIIGQEGSPAENSDTLVTTHRIPGIIPGTFRALRISDVLLQGNTTSNLVEYTRELTFTNDAAETGEGVLKPESDITFELASAPVRTIAHWIKLSRQVVDDAPMLANYVDTRLRYGVELRRDNQLLNGNGTGQNIGGMTKSGNFTAFAPTSGDTPLDTLNRAKYDIIAADYAATAVVMNPADWGAIERLKTSYGEYIIGNPFGNIGPVLWGLPVVVSNNMTAGKFLMAAFDIAYQVWNRQSTTVEMTESNDTDFVKNLITVRAEQRLALAVYRPASSLYGDLEL